ncbi:MAG: hypothetical protein AAB932_04760 [Patescibacteria group bacterium]
MELLKTREFEKDIKRLDKWERELVREAIGKIQREPGCGKPMEHFRDVFSIRLNPKRLIYWLKKPESKIVLLIYKNRDEVYEYLKRMDLG